MTIRVTRKEKESIFVNNKYTFENVEMVEETDEFFCFEFMDLGCKVKYPKSNYSYEVLNK